MCLKNILLMDEIITAKVRIMMDESHTLRERIERASNMEVSSQATVNYEGCIVVQS